jgi:hypothetical protein
LAVGPATRVVVNIESELIGGNSQAGFVRYPGNDFFEDASQERRFVYLILITKREVQILREALRLEVTPRQEFGCGTPVDPECPRRNINRHDFLCGSEHCAEACAVSW